MTRKKIYIIKNSNDEVVGACFTLQLALELADIINGTIEKTNMILAEGEEFTLSNNIGGNLYF